MSLIIKRYPDLSGPLYHYGGTVVLRFSPSQWLYLWQKGDELITLNGVTSILKVIGGKKTDSLIGWAVKTDFEQFLKLLAEYRRNDGFAEAQWDEIELLVTRAKKAHKEHLETAGEIGHGAHYHLEHIAKSLIVEDENRLLELLAKWPEDENSCNAAIAAVAFLVDHNVRFISTERRVLSLEWLVCGTMDGDALVDSCGKPECPCAKFPPFKDKRMVLDYKTSNNVYSSMFGQMAMYRKARCEEAEFDGESISYDGSVLLRIGKDDAQEFECWFTFGDDEYRRHLALFKAALDLKLSVEEVDGWMDSIRDTQRAEAKALREAVKMSEMRVRCPKADDYKGSRLSKCLPDGTQCEACHEIYVAKHPTV